MPLTHKPSVVATRILDLLVAGMTDLGLRKVYYGDQNKVDESPTACVEAGPVNRPMDGVPDMILNTFQVFVIVYHSRVQDNQTTKLEAEQFAEAIEDYLHTNLQLRDASGDPASEIVIHGWVIENMAGYATKGVNTLWRASRLTWQGISKSSLRFGP